MNFSFVLPTLGNKYNLRSFLSSLERTTKDKNKIEVLLAVDEGRLDITRFVESLKLSYRVEIFQRPQTKDFSNDYYNWLANRSTGKNIIAFNDDAWIRTQDWDAKLLTAIKEYGWSVYMLDIPDTARIKYQNNFPCFPCVSRRAMNTLGWLLCKDVPMYPADKITHSVYYHARRIIPIRNVLIEHEHVIESDPSKARMMEIFRENAAQNKPVIIGDYILKLAVVAAGENNKKFNKINRIINILKGE